MNHKMVSTFLIIDTGKSDIYDSQTKSKPSLFLQILQEDTFYEI